jgi:hypothetical protein
MSNQDVINIFNEDLTHGESQTVEFIEDFPETAKNLGNEIAAFATTNSGRIYLGIDDDGNIHGLSGINSLNDIENKDEYLKRIQGITRDLINPPIRVEVNFLESEDNIIIQIIIPKGDEPVYFCQYMPYVRDLTSSRRAIASEVKELHLKYFQRYVSIENVKADKELLITTLNNLSDILLIQSNYRDRFVKPDIDQIKYYLGNIGETLNRIRLETKIKELGIADDLKRLSDALEELTDRRIRLDDFSKTINNAIEINNKTLKIIEEDIGSLSILDQSDFIEKNIEYLKDEWDNREKYLNRGQREQLRQTLIDFGFLFHRLGHIPFEKKETSEKLRNIGESLWSISTHEKFYPGLGYSPFVQLDKEMKQIFLLADGIISALH